MQLFLAHATNRQMLHGARPLVAHALRMFVDN